MKEADRLLWKPPRSGLSAQVSSAIRMISRKILLLERMDGAFQDCLTGSRRPGRVQKGYRILLFDPVLVSSASAIVKLTGKYNGSAISLHELGPLSCGRICCEI
jgi:hypothetical protein